MSHNDKAKGRLLVVSGYSGVGKGTVIKALMKQHPEYVFSVSATTRAARPGDQRRDAGPVRAHAQAGYAQKRKQRFRRCFTHHIRKRPCR